MGGGLVRIDLPGWAMGKIAAMTVPVSERPQPWWIKPVTPQVGDDYDVVHRNAVRQLSDVHYAWGQQSYIQQRIRR